jgi:hypothetical protein
MIKRTKSNLAFRISAAAAIVASMASCSKPSPGILELRASRDAVRAAQSWQEDVGAQAPTGQWMIVSLEKVECPNRMDRVAMLRDPHNRSVHELMYDGAYYSKGDGIDWLKVPDGKIAAITCGQGPQLMWDGVLYDDLDAVQSSGEVRAGKSPMSSDAACTWWEVAPAKGASAHYTVCIHSDDHLPYIVHSHEHNLNYTYTLSNWNTTKVVLPESIGNASD